MTKQEIIEKRKEYMPYDEAEKLQKQLIGIYKKEYKPKHDAETYLKLILDYGVTEIEERHPQSNNYPDNVFKCFSVVSQHVHGYTKEHCLDQIYEAVQNKKERIEQYKKLPTLEELVNSNTEIDLEKTYYTKEKGSYEDSCDGHDGGSILEMREIGIKKYKELQFKKFYDYFMTDEIREIIKNSFKK